MSRETLRRGALAALTAGRLLPGLGIAITAAGFIWSQQDGLYDPALSEPDQEFEYGATYDDFSAIPGCVGAPAGTFCRAEDYAGFAHLGKSSVYGYNESRVIALGHCTTAPCEPDENGYWPTYYVSKTVHQNEYAPGDYAETIEGEVTPVPDDALPQLDEHLPGSIVDDFWAEDPAALPEPWADAISVLPFSNIDAAGQTAPEAHQAVSRWAENMTAKMNAEPLPNPETDAEGNTAAEQQLEEWDKPIPPFAEVTPEWQVETVDSLPDYNIGLGSGSCPGPTAIALPAPFGGSLSLDWQPLCDFASMIRGAVIAVCMILSLYIVLRST